MNKTLQKAHLQCVDSPRWFANVMHRTPASALVICFLMLFSTTLAIVTPPMGNSVLNEDEHHPHQVSTTTMSAFTGGMDIIASQVGSPVPASIPLEPGHSMTEGELRATFEGEQVTINSGFSVGSGTLTGTGTGTLIDGASIVLETAFAGPPQASANSTTVLGQVTWSGTHAYDTLELGCGSSSCGQITASGALTIYANTVRINSGASIIANDLTSGGTGQGGATTTTSAGRNDGGGGGGYGGAGAAGGGASGGAGGASYGNGSQAGSQGGGVSSSVHPAVAGGLGGGYVRIIASNVIVNGSIQASGGDGDHGGQMSSGTGTGGSGGGGGSGGAIIIRANAVAVSSTGAVRANGGDGGGGANGVQNGVGFGMYDGGDGGGGGGGGRISIATQTGQYTNAGSVQANGGGGGTKGLLYGTGVDGLDGSTGSNGAIVVSTWTGYVSTSNATVNDGAFITDPLTVQQGDASGVHVNHQVVQPSDTNISVFQRYTLAGNTTTFDHWTAWMEGNISGETLPRHRHIQFMYVLNRTGAVSPEVTGIDMQTTKHSTLSNYRIVYDGSQDLISSCTEAGCTGVLGITNNFTENGNGGLHTIRLEIPNNATFTDDMHVFVKWHNANTTGLTHPNLTSVTLGTTSIIHPPVNWTAFGHDIVVPMTVLNQEPRMMNGADISGMEWSVIDLVIGFDGPVVATASNLIAGWNYTALIDVNSAVNRLILEECGSFYTSTAGQCLGPGTDYSLSFLGSTSPQNAPSFTVVLSEPSFVWMDDIAPQITTLEHRQGTEIRPDVRVGESYSMIVLDGAGEQDLTVDFLGYGWVPTDGTGNAVSMTYSPPLGGYYLTIPTAGMDPTQTHQTNLTFRAMDANSNELTPYPVYSMTIHPATPSIESLRVQGTTLESGNTSTGTWGITNASFEFMIEESNQRSDLDVAVDLHHAIHGTMSLPLTWEANESHYVGSWRPLRADIGQWSVEVVMQESSGLSARVSDGYQLGADALITLSDTNGPGDVQMLHEPTIETGESLMVNASWSGDENETYSGAINLMQGDDLIIRKLILTTPHTSTSTVFNLTGVEPGAYTLTMELIDDQGNPTIAAITSSLTVLQPWVSGTVLSSSHNNVDFRVYGETSFRTGEGIVDVRLEGSNWSEQRNISTGTFDLTFSFGGPTSATHRFNITVCDVENATSCHQQTAEVDYTAALNLAVTSSCQLHNGTTASTDEHVLMTCLVTNSGPLAIDVNLASGDPERITGAQASIEPMQSIQLSLRLFNGSEDVTINFQWTLTAFNPVNSNVLETGTHDAVRSLPAATSEVNNEDGVSSETEGGWLLPVLGLTTLLGGAAAATVLMRRRPEGNQELEQAGFIDLDEVDETQSLDDESRHIQHHDQLDTNEVEPTPDMSATSVDEHGYEWFTRGDQHWYRTADSDGTWFPYEG